MHNVTHASLKKAAWGSKGQHCFYTAKAVVSGFSLLSGTMVFLFFSISRDFLKAGDKENIFNADHFPLWYRRAAEQIPGSFVYSIPFSTGGHPCWRQGSVCLGLLAWALSAECGVVAWMLKRAKFSFESQCWILVLCWTSDLFHMCNSPK